MGEKGSRFIQESETTEQPKTTRFISVDTPQIREDGGDIGHDPKNHSKQRIWLLLLIPVLVLLVFYLLIDNPKARIDQRPSVVYCGETETDHIRFDFLPNLPAYYYNVGDLYLEFYIETDTKSKSLTYYGYVPSVIINRAVDEYKENSFFIVNTNDIYEHIEKKLGDSVFHDDVKKSLLRGEHYVVKVKGITRGHIFNRPEKDRFCSFFLEEKKKEASPLVNSAVDKASPSHTTSTPDGKPTTNSNTEFSSGQSSNRNNNVNDSGSDNSSSSGNSSITVVGSGNIGGNSNSSSNNTNANLSVEAGHEWVDLGTGIKWATCNLGASYSSDSGSWYAWGETKPKASSSWSNYSLRTSGDDINNVVFTKYNTRDRWGAVDNKVRLEISDDAARQTWGGRWRTPSKEEWEALINKCSWVWTSVDGISGYQVTGTNGNSIFLPKAGRHGIYWSSSLKQEEPPFAWSFVMLSGNYYMEDYNRTCQYMIRPVF